MLASTLSERFGLAVTAVAAMRPDVSHERGVGLKFVLIFTVNQI